MVMQAPTLPGAGALCVLAIYCFTQGVRMGSVEGEPVARRRRWCNTSGWVLTLVSLLKVLQMKACSETGACPELHKQLVMSMAQLSHATATEHTASPQTSLVQAATHLSFSS